MEYMNIINISITEIPWDHMEKLVSIVIGKVLIHNITHTDHLVSILPGVKCSDLWLGSMELGEWEIRALVTAMRDGVQRVKLG